MELEFLNPQAAKEICLNKLAQLEASSLELELEKAMEADPSRLHQFHQAEEALKQRKSRLLEAVKPYLETKEQEA